MLRLLLTSYRFPYAYEKEKVIVFKESYKNPGGFYLIDAEGKEKRLLLQGIALDSYFTHKNKKLAWAEMGFDARWSWKDFSNIIIYDLASGKKRKITSRSKYLSPDISHSGDRLAVVQVTPDQRAWIYA